MMKVWIRYIIFLLFCFKFSTISAQDKVLVTSVPFNTPEREYAPVYHKGNIVFCGSNLQNEVLTYVDNTTNKQLSDIYLVKINDYDSVGEVTLFSKELKTSFHDGPITFSKDGNVAYFTRSQRVKKLLKNSTKIVNTLGVYKATFDGIKWGNITSCSFNSPDYNVGHPSLSSDGGTLYVVSDKPGGFGGKDIYYCKIENGHCGPLLNLGAEVNSEADEMFPFISENNQLYFSSNKEGGIGGLDIYRAIFLNNKWQTPIVLGTNYNSTFDDFGIVLNKNNREGYFSSNRLGSDDIFKISIEYPPFDNCEELVNELLCYEFYEEATLNADSVAMIYEWDFGDGHKERALETYHCYEKSGHYIVQLNIMDPQIGKTFINEATYELDIESINQPYINCLDTVSINQPFQGEVKQGKWEDFTIDNFYVDYGDSSVIEKNNLRPHLYKTGGFKELKVLIAGEGSSQDIETKCFYKTIYIREDSSMLVEEKKFLENLSYSNFSAEKLDEIDEPFYALELFSTNKSIANDSILLKNYNDRVREIYNDKNNTYSYVIGHVNNPFELINEFRKAHESGFEKSVVKAFEKGKVSLADLGMAYNTESGEVNVVLNNIHFEYNGHLLDAQSKKELEKLVIFLNKNKTIHIQIGAHTDASRNVEKAKQIFKAKGLHYTKQAHDKMSSSYNLKLSKQRAKSVKEYLITKGIDEYRLSSVGYGESKPIAPNTKPDGEDNPKGRAKNRRVEFTIIHRE